MSDHLPECIYNGGNWHTLRPCICDRLRACEARVSAFYNAEIEKQGAQWEASCRQYYRSGSDDGKSLALSAARDAVAALPCFGAAEQGHNDAALAAIDALKEEDK